MAIFLAPWSLRLSKAASPPWPARFLILWLLFRLMLASDLRDAGIDLVAYPQLRDVELDTPKPHIAGLVREEAR